jgi:hypothetical protein
MQGNSADHRKDGQLVELHNEEFEQLTRQLFVVTLPFL